MSESAPRSMDWLGASLVTLGLGLIVYGLIDSGEVAGATGEIALVAGGLITLVLFVVVERGRVAPMVPLSLFRSRTFAGANLLTLLLYGALGGALFFVPFNLIQVQGYGPTAAGASLLPFVLLIFVMSPAAGVLYARIGARLPLVLGPLLTAAGFLLLALPAIGGSYWSTFFPGFLVLGLGVGITVAPLTSAVMGAVSDDHAGVASGVNNAVSRAAALLAIAVLGVVLRSRFDTELDAELATLELPANVAATIAGERSKLGGADLSGLEGALQATFARAYVTGFRAVMLACGALATLGALAALVLIRSETTPRSAR